MYVSTMFYNDRERSMKCTSSHHATSSVINQCLDLWRGNVDAHEVTMPAD